MSLALNFKPTRNPEPNNPDPISLEEGVLGYSQVGLRSRVRVLLLGLGFEILGLFHSTIPGFLNSKPVRRWWGGGRGYSKLSPRDPGLELEVKGSLARGSHTTV